METEDGGCDAFTGLEVKEFHNEIWGGGNLWFLLSPHCVDYRDRTGRRLVPAGCFLLRLIQASLALVAVFWPQAPKASRIIDLKE